MILENFSNSQAVENLGWTLLHSIWQIALVAFWLWATLRVSAKSSANSRYLTSLFALGLSLILPLATFLWLSQNSTGVNQKTAHFNREDAASFGKTIQPPENFSPPSFVPNHNPANDDFLVSVETFQSDLAEIFSARAPIIVGLWILGIAFSAARLFGGIWQTRRYRSRANSAPDADWQQRFDDLCERLKIKRTVRLAKSKIVATPMVIGWLKPVVLVPAGVFLNMHPRELETILAHELVHIRRADYFVNLAQNFVEILFFYHPATWWIAANIRRERECACDDAVVKILEDSRIVYASALANLEELRQTANRTQSPVLVAASGGNLMKRIQRIIKNKNAETGAFQTSLWSASLIFALISALLIALFSQAADSPVNAQTKPSGGKTKKLAVGFVSIPPVDRMENPPKDSDATARLLIEKLKSHRVPAIGFVHGSMISDGEKLYPVRAETVRIWRDAGFEIGIGGYKHIWFHNTPVDEYIANVEKNETITKKLLAEKNLPLRYFSYPFLNNGKTLEDKTKFENWLAARGLKPVKYTFDNQEWMYSYAYDMARLDNDINTMREIRAEYLDYMTKMLEHYEAYSQEIFGRDIAQTMVLTPSRLVTDVADEFFGMLKTRGYKFVSMDEAQADEAYQTKEAIVETQSGISWFERWQMAQGKKLRDEPPVGESIQRTWENRIKNPPPPVPPAPPAPPAKKIS